MSQSTHPSVNHLGDSERRLETLRANRAGAYWPWLLCKEAKQLAPLFIALAACGFVMHLLARLGNEYRYIHAVSLIMVPLLFSIGAGPMLVSQEKEQRTLGWIGSLPVNPRSIIFSKYVVCVAGLVLAWIVSVAMTWMLSSSFSISFGLKQVEPLAFISGTFSVLSLGFALTWMFSSAVSSLVALVVASSVAAIFGKIALTAIVSIKDSSLENVGLVLFGLVMAVATIFYGPRVLVAPAESVLAFSGTRQRRNRHPQKARAELWTLTPSSSLIWQIGRQNTFLWSGLLLVFVMSGFLFFSLSFNAPSPADISLAIVLPIGLTLSWLGASVFGSDAYRGRINFLAQRGVAPRAIWWTRMILPLGIIILGLIGFTSLQMLPIDDGLGESPRLDVPLVAVGVLTIFGFTQWFAQWTRSTLIGFCVAPAIAAMIIGYQSFAIFSLQAPFWIFLLSFGVAMLATRIMICPWMDRRFDWRYWTSHGAMLLLALVIPLIPFLYTWATYPDMPSDLKRSLSAEVKEYQESPRPASLDLKSNNLAPNVGDKTAESSDVVSAVSERIDAMEQELRSTEGPVGLPGNAIAMTADLLSLRMDAVLDSKQPDDRAQKDIQRYRQVIVLLDNLVRRLRLSERLKEQNYADVIERWLVSELGKPGRRAIFTDQQYARMVAGLADQDARNQARRRAVVMTWNESRSSRRIFSKRKADVAVATAELLEQLESSVPRPVRYQSELEHVGLGVYSVSLPTDGLLWHRPWETQAKQMAQALKSTSAVEGDNDE